MDLKSSQNYKQLTLKDLPPSAREFDGLNGLTYYRGRESPRKRSHRSSASPGDSKMAEERRQRLLVRLPWDADVDNDEAGARGRKTKRARTASAEPSSASDSDDESLGSFIAYDSEDELCSESETDESLYQPTEGSASRESSVDAEQHGRLPTPIENSADPTASLETLEGISPLAEDDEGHGSEGIVNAGAQGETTVLVEADNLATQTQPKAKDSPAPAAPRPSPVSAAAVKAGQAPSQRRERHHAPGAIDLTGDDGGDMMSVKQEIMSREHQAEKKPATEMEEGEDEDDLQEEMREIQIRRKLRAMEKRKAKGVKGEK